MLVEEQKRSELKLQEIEQGGINEADIKQLGQENTELTAYVTKVREDGTTNGLPD